MKHPDYIQIGSSGNHIEGWLNLEQSQLDIRDTLPFPDGSIRGLFLEHVIEHVTHRQAYRFFQEARRVLAPMGVLRLAFPSVAKLQTTLTDEYARFFLTNCWGDGTRASCIEATIFEFGHEALWTGESMCAVLSSLGFTTVTMPLGQSHWPCFRGLERHCSEAISNVETVVVEGLKPPGDSPEPSLSRVNALFRPVLLLTWPGSDWGATAAQLEALGIAHRSVGGATREEAHHAALSTDAPGAPSLILEPGALFCPGFVSLLDSAVRALPENWHTLHLDPAGANGQRLTSHLAKFERGTPSWRAYAVSNAGAEAMRAVGTTEERSRALCGKGAFIATPAIAA